MADHAKKLLKEIDALKTESNVVKLSSLRWQAAIFALQVKDDGLKISLANAWKKVNSMYESASARD